MSSFGLFPAAWLLCIVPLLLALFGCGASTEAAILRLPFQQNHQIQLSSQIPDSIETTRNSLTNGSVNDKVVTGANTIDAVVGPVVLDEPVELEVVSRFEQAMTAYRVARSQPVQPDFSQLELTHTPATAVQLKAGLRLQDANRLALRYPDGQEFSARYAAVSVSGATTAGGAIGDAATVTGCTHYHAIEFDSSNGSDVNVVDEKVSFTAQLVLSPDQDWLLDTYVAFPLDAWGEVQC